jgi:hypothetical protein
MGEGLRQAYPLVPDLIEYPVQAAQVARRLTFGIDVGWVNDETIVTVVETIPGWGVGNVIEVAHIQGGAFHEQAPRVFSVIDKYPWQPQRIGIEWNGGGAGLYYQLARPEFFPGCQRVTVHNKVKFGAVSQLQKLFEEGRLGVGDPLARMELQGLQIDYKGADEDRWEITHSDTHSALLVAVMLGGLS